MSERSSLHWFPMYPADFLSSPAVGMMLPEQRGAYITLLFFAWGDGSAEPSVADDDDALALLSGLGKRWAKFGPLVRAQFDARDGRLYNGKLSEVWHAQQRKHSAVAEKGRKGGKAKAGRKQGPSTATAEGVAEAYQLEPEGAVEALPLTGQELLPAPAADAAPAPADAAPRDPDGQNGTGDYLDRPSVREEYLRRGLRPSGAPLAIDTAAQIAAREAEDARNAVHYAAIKQAAWAWIRTHPAQARALGRRVRRSLDFPLDAPLTGLKAEALESQMVAAISAGHEWPPPDEWDGVSPFVAAVGALPDIVLGDESDDALEAVAS